MIKILTLFLLILLSLQLPAQDEVRLPCKHNDMDLLRPLHQDDPAALARMSEHEAELEAFTEAFQELRDGDASYLIPVVFHIIHDNGPENISDAQIHDALRILNEDLRRLNPDWESSGPTFVDLAADVGVEFRLARMDPQGNCSPGITRTVSSLTYDGDQAMKQLIQWPRNKYLNVWVSSSANGAAGYTYRPGSVSDFPSGDGIVMQHTYTGSIGTGSPGRSRTLTHEVGHWLNLLHTWGQGNTPGLESNCDMDDNVDDTPNTKGWTSCNMNASSCGSLDNIANYMDYTYCSRMFTQGQAARMVAALNSTVSQRNQLWQASNLAATGVTGQEQLCAAVFAGNAGIICAGTSITFQDQSFHNVMSRSWSFPGGSPSTSTEMSPVVTYSEPGIFPVTLSVSDGVNTLSTTQVEYVTVLPVPGNTTPFQEGFESAGVMDEERWTVVDGGDGNTFQMTGSAAYTGSGSLKIANDLSFDGEVDELISTTYDMSEAETISISFRYAYARRNSSNDDRLRLYVSSNCGTHWSLRRQLRGNSDLVTAPQTSAPFIPAGPDQWGYAVIENIQNTMFVENFRFKLQFEGDGGNTLYIDDININGMPVGLEETGALTTMGMMVVPNPATDYASLRFDLRNSGNTRITLSDLTGRELHVLHNGGMAAGAQRLELPAGDLGAGIYFIRLVSSDGEEVVRFVVE